MNAPYGAVFFFEADDLLSDGVPPLALESLHGRPVLFWMGNALAAQGVRHFFVAAPRRCEAEILSCFPAGAEVVVSDRHEDLMRFLETEEQIAVLPRAALPMPRVGIGFAYAAAGTSLRETWRTRMTNAVRDAEPLAGWVPLYGRDTLAELEPLFQPEEHA